MLATFVLCFKIPSKRSPVVSSEQSVSYQPTQNDKFSLLLTIGLGGDEHSFFILNFNAKENRVSVARLPSKTRLSKNGEKNIILNEEFENGGGKGACEALSRFFGIPVSKYISLSRTGAQNLISLFEPIVYVVPENLSQTDRQSSLYIKIDSGHQIMDGLLMLDYLSYSSWSGGESQRIYEGARLICEFLEQNRQQLFKEEGGRDESIILGESNCNISVAELYLRRECIRYILSTGSFESVSLSGSFEMGDSAFVLSQSSNVKISALF